MRTLRNREIYEAICKNLRITQENVTIISAFCKEKALEKLDENIPFGIKKRLLVRFQYQDVVSGASDFSLYPYCREHGWTLFFLPDLHGKVCLFDEKLCIMGSANITLKGLGLVDNCNEELANEYIMEENGKKNVEEIFRMAVKLTDEIYDKMRRCMEKKREASMNGKWDKAITDLFERDVDVLFACELPQNKYPLSFAKEDYTFLGWYEMVDDKNIKEAFKESKSYRWLKTQFRKTGKQELYFGELTAALHRDIINEPKPYRKEVKELLENLICWIEILGEEEFLIDVPRHSTRVRYIG